MLTNCGLAHMPTCGHVNIDLVRFPRWAKRAAVFSSTITGFPKMSSSGLPLHTTLTLWPVNQPFLAELCACVYMCMSIWVCICTCEYLHVCVCTGVPFVVLRCLLAVVAQCHALWIPLCAMTLMHVLVLVLLLLLVYVWENGNWKLHVVQCLILNPEYIWLKLSSVCTHNCITFQHCNYVGGCIL